LSLICVGTAFAQFIFLFDVLTLTRYDLQPLLNFLGSKVMKVVWDGRMDFIELLSTYNVSIGRNVCDLQVAEVLSRSIFRGERDDERLSRLVTYFGPQVWKSPSQFAGIHRVVGLQQCLEENGYRGLVGKDRESRHIVGRCPFPGLCAYLEIRLYFS
jgi:exonuclease 3'-5' domain-containing protein 1